MRPLDLDQKNERADDTKVCPNHNPNKKVNISGFSLFIIRNLSEKFLQIL